MNYTKQFLYLISIFLITYTVHSHSEKQSYKLTGTEINSLGNKDHETIIPLDIIIDISSNTTEIIVPDITNLLISMYGGIKFTVYGRYNDDIVADSMSTDNNLFIGVSHIINTTLDPILIPPTRPGGGSTRSSRSISDKDLVLLGSYTLFLAAYDTNPGNYTISLTVKKAFDNQVVDSEDIHFTVYSPYALGDLEITHAEVLKPFNSIRDRIILKAHIQNVQDQDIIQKAKVSVYYKKMNSLVLLDKATIPPLAGGQATTASFYLKHHFYKEIEDALLYIVVDEDDEILEYTNSNNSLNYDPPKIEFDTETIRAYPNPFENILNISFKLHNTNTSLAVFTMYNKNGINIYRKGYIYPAGAGNQSITYKNDKLRSGTYYYGLLLEGVQYYGTVLKR